MTFIYRCEEMLAFTAESAYFCDVCLKKQRIYSSDEVNELTKNYHNISLIQLQSEDYYEKIISFKEKFVKTVKGTYGIYQTQKNSFPEIEPLKFYYSIRIYTESDDLPIYVKYREIISVEEADNNHYEITFMRTPIYNPF